MQPKQQSGEIIFPLFRRQSILPHILLSISSHYFDPPVLPLSWHSALILSFPGDMILAFCLSVLVGLLLGALVYVLLTWASRRRATARITRRSKKRSGTSQTNNPKNSQMGHYRSTFLNVYRQPSLEPVGPLGSKPSLETSTFRPLPKKSRAALDMGEDTEVIMPEDTATSNSSDSASLVPNKRHSFWLGSNGLKGFLPSQTPPPAYDSVIHAFEETCTWICPHKYVKNWKRWTAGDYRLSASVLLFIRDIFSAYWEISPSLTLFFSQCKAVGPYMHKMLPYSHQVSAQYYIMRYALGWQLTFQNP